MKPYEDQLNLFDNSFVRTFDNVQSDELVWHRDKKDRTVKVIKSKNWKIQFDNELPNIMDEGDTIKIKKFLSSYFTFLNCMTVWYSSLNSFNASTFLIIPPPIWGEWC